MDPNPFTTALPTQLRAWDATSLRAYMECPRKYELSIVNGWRREGVHTQWGSLYHGAIERYDRARLDGKSKDDALDEAFAWALENSGTLQERSEHNYEWQPWGAHWRPFWRCTDEGPILKSGPNKGQPDPKRRCQCAKALQPGDAPPMCPLSGHPVETQAAWVYDDEIKNRHTLLRAIVWYVDEQPEEGGVQPYRFPDGRDGLEVSFAVPLPINTPDGEPYLLTGNIDSFVQFGEDVWPRERKTTQKSVGTWYFDRYSPDVQIDTYDLVTSTIYPDLVSKGVMLEAAQTGAEFAKFHRQFIYSTEGRRAEHLRDILYWIKRAEADAQAGYYPQNKAACYAHGGCPFREICNRDPSTRDLWLHAEFTQRWWNPLAVR